MAALPFLVAAAALLAGASVVGEKGAALAAIAVFVALALSETLLPLRRGFAELGRMAGAAERIMRNDRAPDSASPQRACSGDTLLSITTDRVDLHLARGDTAVVTGPSGAGKTTLLMQAAGLLAGTGITVCGHPPREWDEQALRKILCAVPQRSALIAGTIRDNLSLGGECDEEAMWRALDAVRLKRDIAARGGLDSVLGEGGTGLSGGQAKRLALARALLRKPMVLLLDEPTEGLDESTAAAVLQGIRDALPQAAILVSMHRGRRAPGVHASCRVGW